MLGLQKYWYSDNGPSLGIMGNMSINLLVLIFQNFILLRQATAETHLYRSLSFSSKMANDVIVDNNDVIYSLTSRSASQCSTICQESLRCVSFVFNRDNLNCTLLSTTPSKTVPTGTLVHLYGKCFVRRDLEAGDLKSTIVTTTGKLCKTVLCSTFSLIIRYFYTYM